MGGSKCSVGVAGTIEKGQLAAQMENHLGCQSVARHRCLGSGFCCVDHHVAHVPESWANEERHNNRQVDQADKTKVSQVDLGWQLKGEIFLARGPHDASGHQGRGVTHRWACNQGVGLTMDTVSQIIHDCETCAEIKQAKWVKALSCVG